MVKKTAKIGQKMNSVSYLTRRARVGEELQYSLLFPDIFVSVGGDKKDFSNLI